MQRVHSSSRCRVGIFILAVITAIQIIRPANAADPVRQASSADKENARYTFRKQHDPNGIGKFYFNREIAHVMGFAGVKWLERPEREEEERPSRIADALKLKPGEVVADIGAGSGVISLLMAEQVGPKGKVVAVDIQQEMLDRLHQKLQEKKVSNVDLVRGTAKSPRLPPASVDVVIMVDVYHEFRYPYEMTKEIAAAVKPGGRVVLVEYRKEDPKVRRLIKLVHTMTEAQVKKELEQPEFGLKWKETLKMLPRQHIIVFERQKTKKRRHRSEGG